MSPRWAPLKPTSVTGRYWPNAGLRLPAQLAATWQRRLHGQRVEMGAAAVRHQHGTLPRLGSMGDGVLRKSCVDTAGARRASSPSILD